MPDGGPGVLVAPQPGVRAHDDREDRDDREGDQQPDELQLRRGASSVRRTSAVTSSCGQALHEQEADAAEQSRRVGSSTWSVRRPARTNEMHDEQRAEVDEQRPGHRAEGSRSPRAPRRIASRPGAAGLPPATRRPPGAWRPRSRAGAARWCVAWGGTAGILEHERGTMIFLTVRNTEDLLDAGIVGHTPSKSRARK